MVIKQSFTKKYWTIEIDFKGYTFTDGDGPYYVSGDFNDWVKDDKNYKVPIPRKKGANNLLPITLRIPSEVKQIEFKMFNKGYYMWMEPIHGYGLYSGNHKLVLNSFGTFNVRVEQKIS